MIRSIRHAIAILLLFPLIACDSPDRSPEDQPIAEQSDTAKPTGAETAATDENTGDAGARGASAACDLITTEEVTAGLGTEVREADGVGTGDGDYSCMYRNAGGQPVLATALNTGGAVEQAWSSYAADERSEAVSGIGDEAMLYGGSVLMIRKGDQVFSLQATAAAGVDEAERRTILTEFGRIAAGRM